MKTVLPALIKEAVGIGERALTAKNMQQIHKTANGDVYKMLAYVFAPSFIYAANGADS